MEISNEDEIDTCQTQPRKKPLLHNPSNSKPFKNIYRPSHYKSYKYADIGFTITKQNKKYVAHCRICNRTLGNTAYARLKGHRNICKEASLENGIEHLLYPLGNNEIYDTKETDSRSQQFITQTSNDDPGLTFNMTSKIEPVECELNGNPCNSNQEFQLLNEENELKLNMIEVLLPIKYNKKILFEDRTKKCIDMWIEVLKKAQTLNLAPTGVPWSYARDSLYSAWRLHTLQKKEAIESGQLNIKYNIVDISILQIENASISSDNSSFENETIYTSTCDKTIDDTQSSNNNFAVINTNTISTQTLDEIYKTDLRLKVLQCEAMEIENYRRSLETLELERKLQIPHSKFAAKFFPTLQIQSNGKNNERIWKDTNNTIKVEIDD